MRSSDGRTPLYEVDAVSKLFAEVETRRTDSRQSRVVDAAAAASGHHVTVGARDVGVAR